MNAQDLMDYIGLHYRLPENACIQCDKQGDKFHWYLSTMDDGKEPYYYLPIYKDVALMAEAMAHLSEKNWVDMNKVAIAMWPAIVAAARS